MRGSAVRKSAKERLKELSFPALKLSALIAKGKKIIVANLVRFLPQHCIFRGFIYTCFNLIYFYVIYILFILLNVWLVLSSYIRID